MKMEGELKMSLEELLQAKREDILSIQDLLGCEVDVVPEDSLRERIRERVLKETITL